MGGVKRSNGGHRTRMLARMGSRRSGRPPEADMLAAHDAITTNSRKAQHKLGKQVNQRRHAAHATSLEELSETARPPGPGDPMGGTKTKALAEAR